jgi:hypothetical protein
MSEATHARTTISPRQALAGILAGAGAITGTADAAATAHPDAALLRLGVELDAAWGAERIACAACDKDENAEVEARFHEAVARTGEIARAICDASAATLDGAMVKARALLWCRDGEAVDCSSDHRGNSLEARLARSILADAVAAAAD